MKLKKFFWTNEVIVSFLWMLFFVLVNFTNPNKAHPIIFFAFFILFFAALVGTWSLLELRIMVKMQGIERIRHTLLTALRHGVMVGIVVAGILFMRLFDILHLWQGMILVVAIVLLEAYFLTRKLPDIDTGV